MPDGAIFVGVIERVFIASVSTLPVSVVRDESGGVSMALIQFS